MLVASALLALGIAGVERAGAQIEGERGIPPIASSRDIQVSGIEVDARGDNGEEARENGWAQARREAWARIGGPKMSDGQLDSMTIAVVIEEEKISPRRYVARLGVIFDRARAAAFIGAGNAGVATRSAPMLTIPVLYSGGVRQVFEVQGPWQRAWANFQAAGSRIDYVRPTGSGGESLILNAGQTERRSRIWWGTVLGQFEAADVVIPVARLERRWPGGPVDGRFTARYGPDNEYLASFDLTAKSESEVPRMLAEAVIRIDRMYQEALARGILRPDPTLRSTEAAFDAALGQLRVRLEQTIRPAQADDDNGTGEATGSDGATPTPTPTAAVSGTYTVQFASPDAGAVDAAIGAARGAPGVSGVATTSRAIGGTSVMRVTFAGDAEALAAALRARGWNVSVSGTTLSMTR